MGLLQPTPPQSLLDKRGANSHSPSLKAGPWCVLHFWGSPRCSRWFRVLGFSHPYARTHVELLGPCFKTGRLTPCLTGILHAIGLVCPSSIHPRRRTVCSYLGFYPQAASALSFPPGQTAKRNPARSPCTGRNQMGRRRIDLPQSNRPLGHTPSA
jgi:hypothetical protein